MVCKGGLTYGVLCWTSIEEQIVSEGMIQNGNWELVLEDV